MRGFPFGVKLLAGSVLIYILARLLPSVASIYIDRIYPFVTAPAAFVSSLVEFSIGEAIFVGIVVALPIAMLRKRFRKWLSFVAAAAALSTLHFGLLYARPSPEVVFDISQTSRSAEVSTALAKQVASYVVLSRNASRENSKGVVRELDVGRLDDLIRPLQADALERYDVAAVCCGRTKPLATSFVLRRYVTGIFLPVVAEPTVATPLYPALGPSTVSHELAHLNGFASEDEASFVGWLTLIHSPAAELRYASWLDLWIGITDRPPITNTGVGRDLVAIREHHDRYSGGADARVFRRAQDSALKAIGEREGVRGYDRVTELALSWLAKNGFPKS